MNKVYACIDLKSFYASVECHERKLEPLNTNLVVADKNRTSKTICLAVTPSLKQYGIPGRVRLFELEKKVKEINYKRKLNAPYYKLNGKSYIDSELKENPELELDYVIAPPRMSLYMKYSTKIYNIYLDFLSSEDIYVYSIDEVFCDLTSYLNTYKLTPLELVSKMIKKVYECTGITATAGIGTNLYLAKVAMDIVAKHAKPNSFGVRIAELDENTYKRKLWNHTPITDFWRVGKGYQKRLNEINLQTMGEIARLSIKNEEILYNLFGINAELLIDHAWGYEPCTMKDIKEFKPSTNSICSGQVLHSPYTYEKAKIILKEMIDSLSLDLVKKGVVSNDLTLTIGYDIESVSNPNIRKYYNGEIIIDLYGRKIPKPAHGTIKLDFKTSSSKIIIEKSIELYDKIINKKLLIRRINISANNLIKEVDIKEERKLEQYNLFVDYKKLEEEKIEQQEKLEEEKKLQTTLIEIKDKYGKNAILKGINLSEGATAIERNKQVGGHKE